MTHVSMTLENLETKVSMKLLEAKHYSRNPISAHLNIKIFGICVKSNGQSVVKF